MKDDPVDDAKGQVSEALRARRGEPSKDAEEAARQVTELRQALTRDLDELRGRMPEPSEVGDQAKTVGGLAAGGTAALGILVLLLRRRGKRKAEERHVRDQAMALARELARLDLEPEDVVDEGRGPWGRILAIVGLLAAVAGGAVALRQRMQGDDEVWEA